ncbi:MAG: Holliday junction branch migration protein RuvA [Verrucomicrobia bacterium]|nr:Holliday junction branch migration protein RuvA [Verrucomicrobiota bacterium]
MITFLDGVLEEKRPTRIVLAVRGVGYEVLIPLSSYDRLPGTGQQVRILTRFIVREDSQQLFGFMTDAERDTFDMLITISGIGPRIAMSALSGLSARELKAAVVAGDVKRLSSVSGIGKKMAERIVVELRHKLSDTDALEAVAGVDGSASDDVRIRDSIMALISLGYKQADAQKMIMGVVTSVKEDASVEEIVRKALTK